MDIRQFSSLKKTLLVCVFATMGISSAALAAPLTWEDAVKRAEAENPEVTAARENLNAAESKKNAAYAAFLPTIKGNIDYSNSQTELNGVVSLNNNNYRWSAGLSGSWNLFAGFQDDAKIDQAEADRKAAEAALQIARAKVSNDLKTAFESAAYARDYSKLTTAILKRREENQKLVQLRYESGRENKGSVLLAEAYLEQARYDDLQAKNSIRTSSASLGKILAYEGDAAVNIEVVGNVPITDPPAKTPNFDSLSVETPEYRQAVEQTRSSTEAVRVARATFLPSLDLTSSLSRRDEEFFPDRQNVASVGVSLTIPLFNGGRDYNSYQAASATAAASAATRDNLLRETRRKLEQAWATYIESGAKLRSDESFRKAALVRSDIARTKYNNGLLSFDDWDVIENDLISRQKAVLQTRRERTTVEAAWEQAQGKGVWQ